MQQQIEKELLLARLEYLKDIHKKPGSTAVHPTVVSVTKDFILDGHVPNYMAVESLFNYLLDNAVKDKSRAQECAHEITSFIA